MIKKIKSKLLDFRTLSMLLNRIFEIIYNLNKTLQNYQININKFSDGNYIKNFFNKDIELSKMAFDILNGDRKSVV